MVRSAAFVTFGSLASHKTHRPRETEREVSLSREQSKLRNDFRYILAVQQWLTRDGPLLSAWWSARDASSVDRGWSSASLSARNSKTRFSAEDFNEWNYRAASLIEILGGHSNVVRRRLNSPIFLLPTPRLWLLSTHASFSVFSPLLFAGSYRTTGWLLFCLVSSVVVA